MASRNCNRNGIGVLCAMALVLGGISCEEWTLQVAKVLDNDEDLEEDQRTTVTVDRGSDGSAVAKIETPHPKARINLYFANDEKNILVADFTYSRVSGSVYKTPHGEIVVQEVGPSITSLYDNGIAIKTSTIPSHWFPENVTRMSASVQFDGTIHNYYGIFNFLIGIPDTMVVERYKRLKRSERGPSPEKTP